MGVSKSQHVRLGLCYVLYAPISFFLSPRTTSYLLSTCTESKFCTIMTGKTVDKKEALHLLLGNLLLNIVVTTMILIYHWLWFPVMIVIMVVIVFSLVDHNDCGSEVVMTDVLTTLTCLSCKAVRTNALISSWLWYTNTMIFTWLGGTRIILYLIKYQKLFQLQDLVKFSIHWLCHF